MLRFACIHTFNAARGAALCPTCGTVDVVKSVVTTLQRTRLGDAKMAVLMINDVI